MLFIYKWANMKASTTFPVTYKRFKLIFWYISKNKTIDVVIFLQYMACKQFNWYFFYFENNKFIWDVNKKIKYVIITSLNLITELIISPPSKRQSEKNKSIIKEKKVKAVKLVFFGKKEGLVFYFYFIFCKRISIFFFLG
jgi:hypothetical protein